MINENIEEKFIECQKIALAIQNALDEKGIESVDGYIACVILISSYINIIPELEKCTFNLLNYLKILNESTK